jgi:hypothetical protein
MARVQFKSLCASERRLSLRESTATLAARKMYTVAGRMTRSKRVGQSAVWDEKAPEVEDFTCSCHWRIRPEDVTVWAS